MRNLKRALSLALAAIMLIGMMVVSASAVSYNDLTDKDQIVNKDAVSMLVSLGIIEGKPDGSYAPTENVDRAQMAKMLSVIMNKGVDNSALYQSVNSGLTDITSNWAKGHINYCYTTGIIAGRGNGTFDPSATVTALEAAKMLLVALGYRADEANFTGNGWDTNVNVIATQKGLYEGLENMDVSAALTRDNAAQMIWNALQAVEVEYTYTLVTENGQLVSKVVVQDKAQATVGTDKYDYTLLYDKYKATVTDEAVLKTVDLDAKGTYTLTTADGKTYTKVAGDYTNLLGQSVRVVCKMDGTSVDSVYGVFAADDNAVVSARVNQIESLTANKIEIDGTEYDLASTGLYHIQDGVYASGLGLSKAATSFDTFTLIDNNGDDKYDGAVITTVTPAR